MKQKGFAQILVIILLVAILGGVIYFGMVKGKSSSVTSSPASSSSSTVNWKTYTDTKFGFSFQYPQGAKTTSRSPDPFPVTIQVDNLGPCAGKACSGWLIFVSETQPNPDNLTLKDWAKSKQIIKQVLIDQGNATTPVDTTLGGLPAVRWTTTGGDVSLTFYLVKRTNGNTLITINPQGNEIITDQILSTFKFVGTQSLSMAGCSTKNPSFGYSIQNPQGWTSVKTQDDVSGTTYRLSGTNGESITINCDTAGVGSVVCINGGVVDYPFSINNSEKDGCFWTAGGNGKQEAQFNVKNSLGTFVFGSNGVDKTLLDQILSTFKFNN